MMIAVHMIARLSFIWLACLLWSATARAADVPRVIIGLHDSAINAPQDSNYLYSLAEMPLNHLGLVLESSSVHAPLPDIGRRNDIRGILIWLSDGRRLPLQAMTALARSAAQRNIPVVLFGSLPDGVDASGRALSLADRNRFLEPFGLRSSGDYVPYTHDLKVVARNSALVEFERKLPALPPAAEPIYPLSETATALLSFKRKGEAANKVSAVLITPQGGYAAAGYTHYEDKKGQFLQWYLNPFEFFRRVFKTDGAPIPDTTTMNGRRLFYSHIDGDGWGSVSTADKYAGQGIYAADVILREVARGYPHLPVTVAPIAADIDPAWTGTLQSQHIARELFALPNVEPATHTYTHPFEWSFFGPHYQPENEVGFAKKYSKVRIAKTVGQPVTKSGQQLNFPYDAPRAYGDIPFRIKKEVQGSAAYIDAFCPPNKRVKLLQWSGDTSPVEATVGHVTQAGLLNLNGRDTRFDGEAPSYSAVSPISKRAGRLRQISASHANENVYTDLWRGRFFGFRFLKTSLINTERPLRVKPINVYYHMYSGEKEASLAALKEVLDFASTQELSPITATQFVTIGNGFFSARITPIGERAWKVSERGGLHTLRFDNASHLEHDFSRSDGVLGARAHGTVLYIALDPARPDAVVAVRKKTPPVGDFFALSHSRWTISALKVEGQRAQFRVEGFGVGEMHWHVPRRGPGTLWEVQLSNGQHGMAPERADGTVQFRLPMGAEQGLEAVLAPLGLRPALL